KGRDAADANHERHLVPHVYGRNEEAERHPEEKRQEARAEKDADARDPKVGEWNGQDESDGCRCQEQGDVEDRIAYVHSQKGLAKSHWKNAGHGDQVVPGPDGPLQILAHKEAERADAPLIQEDARMTEQGRMREASG